MESIKVPFHIGCCGTNVYLFLFQLASDTLLWWAFLLVAVNIFLILHTSHLHVDDWLSSLQPLRQWTIYLIGLSHFPSLQIPFWDWTTYYSIPFQMCSKPGIWRFKVKSRKCSKHIFYIVSLLSRKCSEHILCQYVGTFEYFMHFELFIRTFKWEY